eukprot:739851-Amphidinium_carterae.1
MLDRHATLQGHLLRHTPAFPKLLETATPVEMWLRRQTGQPRFTRRGKPRRWNGLYLTSSSNLGFYNYWRIALDRDSWRTFAQLCTNGLRFVTFSIFA